MKSQSSKKKLRIAGLAIIAITGLTAFSAAQTQVKSKPATDENINLKVYHQSMIIGDINMAITAVHYLLAGDPVKYVTWQDTLALLYLQNKAYPQAYLLSNALINAAGYTDLRMEIKGICAKSLRQPAEAINAYAMLYGKTKNPVFGFEELQLQYGIRRLDETIVTGNSLLQSLSPDKKDTVTVMKSDNKTVQQITFKAAVCNVMGLAYMDLKDKTNAIAQFEVALNESPDFELAKNNLAAVQAIADNTKKQ